VSLADVLRSPRLVAVGVDTADPGNAGTLIRIADAMGADAFILAGASVDPYNAKCLRSSAGSIFSVPVIEAPDTHALISYLRYAELVVMASTLNGEKSLDDIDLRVPTAWLFGSEAHGLSAEVAAAADVRVTIPMAGGAESLNVAAAAAICLYQSAAAHRV
jgi:TrmH family RNA methyltransferase